MAMTRQAQLYASVSRMFAEGELVPEDFTEFEKQLAIGDEADVEIDDRLLEKLPRDLYRPQLLDGVGLISLRLNPAVIEAVMKRFQAQSEIDKFAATLGWVGQPTSDFSYTGNGGFGRHFQNASIFWTESFGAKEVHGAIRERYQQMGGERSYLGYPQTNELSSVGANGEEVRYSNFQGGTIFWTAARGAFMLPSFSPITERHQLGAWLHMVGTGFTPNGRVTYWVVNAPNPPTSIGSENAAADGRLGANANTRYVVDLRNLGGNRPPSVARAIDQSTGQVADYPLSYALY
jgi:hypothetical protein